MRFPPVFRLLALAALGAALFRYSLVGQAAIAVLLLGFSATRGRESALGLWRAIRKIRWILFSLVVVYLVFAPEPSVGHGVLPKWTDLDQALRRAGVLILLVCAVELMRQTTPADAIAAALAALLKPLAWLGTDTERFSRRVALTLDAVPRTAKAVGDAASRAGIRRRDLSGWADAAAELIREIEAGDTHTRDAAMLPENPRPRPVDWLVLACVLVVVLGLTGV